MQPTDAEPRPPAAGRSAAELERDRRAQQLLASALSLTAAERVAFLDDACGDDAELRATVEELLHHDAAPWPAFDGTLPATVGPSTALESSAATADLVSGERSYRLVSELGRGGYGTVFLAERADGQYRQRVAIKRLNLGPFASAAARARIRLERQILARLVHPHVARLLDGGELPDGTPFLVLEHIDGVPIDRYCEEHALDVAARVRLFLDVCEAVDYAHRNLVVHRDLKPSNVLVDGTGSVKLLDFGIAKPLEPTDEAAGFETRHGEMPLTPRYASPEQVRGHGVTTATDVYSLGVLLYELLAGRSPYAPSSTPAELVRAICETDPPRPSTAAAGDGETARPRRIDADLDAVVMKAMRKEAAERYGSAAELAGELRAYLEGRPVAARKGSRAYRMGKLLRRHKLPFAAAALFLLTIAGFSASLYLQLAETARQRDAAARERDAAQRERDGAKAVTDLLIDIFKVADPESGAGTQLSARDLLDRGSARVVDGLGEKPEIQARLLHALGRVYQNLGLFEEATTQMERALAVRKSTLKDDPVAYGVVASDLGWLLFDRNELARAEPLLRLALTTLTAAKGPTAEETLAAKNGLATLMRTAGRLEEAEPLSRELVAENLAARGLREPPPASGPPLGAEFRQLGIQLHNLGALEIDLGRYDEAQRHLEQAIAVKSRLEKPSPTSVANSIEALANLADTRERFTAGLALHERALDMRRRAYGDEHPVVGGSLVNRGGALAGLGRHTEALADYRRAATILERAYGRNHSYVALALNNAANSMNALGDKEGALAQHRDVLGIRERVLGPDHPDVAQSLQNIAGLELALGRPREALAADERAVAISTRALGPEHPQTVDQRRALAEDRLALGDAERARTEIEALIPLLETPDQRGHALNEGRFLLARAIVASGGDQQRAIGLARQVRESVVENPDHRAGGLALATIDAWLRDRDRERGAKLAARNDGG